MGTGSSAVERHMYDPSAWRGFQLVSAVAIAGGVLGFAVGGGVLGSLDKSQWFFRPSAYIVGLLSLGVGVYCAAVSVVLWRARRDG